MWSPWASEPDDEDMDGWLRVVWMVCTRSGVGRGMRMRRVIDGKGEGEVLTSGNFARLGGVVGRTGQRIRMGQNRVLL